MSKQNLIECDNCGNTYNKDNHEFCPNCDTNNTNHKERILNNIPSKRINNYITKIKCKGCKNN